MSELNSLTFITTNYYHNGQDPKNYAKRDFKTENLPQIFVGTL
jgi:hypothetical protein